VGYKQGSVHTCWARVKGEVACLDMRNMGLLVPLPSVQPGEVRQWTWEDTMHALESWFPEVHSA